MSRHPWKGFRGCLKTCICTVWEDKSEKYTTLSAVYLRASSYKFFGNTHMYIYMKQPLKNPYGTIYSSKKFTVHSQTNLISHHGANLFIFARIMLVYSGMYFYLSFWWHIICQHCRTKTRVARLSVAQRIFIMNDHNKRHIIFHFVIHICPHVMFVQGSSRTPLQPTVTSLFLNTHKSDL